MANPKVATRRPEYMPQYPWCCHLCQEMSQLRVLSCNAPEQTKVMAISFIREIEKIANDRYGGVQIANLFD